MQTFRQTEAPMSRWGWIFDRSITLVFSTIVLASFWIQASLKSLNVLDVLRGIVVPAIVIFFSLAGRQAIYRFSYQALFGLLLSFGGFFLFQPEQFALHPPYVRILSSCNLLFFWAFLLWSYFHLGRNLSLIPGRRSIVTIGPYNLVRHPIYAAYSSIAANYALSNPGAINFFAAGLIFLGLQMRARAEEAVLTEDQRYIDYKLKQTRLSSSLSLLTPTVILALLVFYQLLKPTLPVVLDKQKTITVQFGFPITELDPSVYDDWGTIFIANHIFPRLLPDESRPQNLAVARNHNLTCMDGARYSPSCPRAALQFEVEEFKSCSGKSLTATTVELELRRLLEKRSWLLKNPIIRRSSKQILITFDNFTGVNRRLKSVFFRFGFSLSQTDDTQVGFGPYCLERPSGKSLQRIAGELISRSPNDPIGRINFVVSEKPSEMFTLALYGTSELVTAKHRIIDTHTPVGYYLVNNPKLKNDDLPWNSHESQILMKRHLVDVDATFPTAHALSNLLPLGTAGVHDIKARTKRMRILYLPSFLPGCAELAGSLKALWLKSGLRAEARCSNTSELIEKSVANGNLDWDGFLTPLSPASADRHAIVDQYFSANSSENWNHIDPTAQDSFRLLGLGKAFIVVRQNAFCGLKANALGLSDILISDLITCESTNTRLHAASR